LATWPSRSRPGPARIFTVRAAPPLPGAPRRAQLSANPTDRSFDVFKSPIWMSLTRPIVARAARCRPALPYAAALLLSAQVAAPAWAQNAAPAPAKPPPTAPAKAAPKDTGPVYHLLADALVATLPQHKGDVITMDEIKADADIIRAKLKALHVHGDMTTATLEREGKGHWIWVVWDIQKMDALSHAPLFPVRHLVSQTFTGNTKLTTAQLTAANGLQLGQKMPDGSISDARTGIEQAYDKAMPGAPVKVRGKVRIKPDGSVLIDWVIIEADAASPGASGPAGAGKK
jgi:hypothetical protein